MLTGQYGHNNGVLSNKPGYGTLDDPDNILPVWLQTRRISDGDVGKCLNGYEKTVDNTGRRRARLGPAGPALVGNAQGYYNFKAGGQRPSARRPTRDQYLTD